MSLTPIAEFQLNHQIALVVARGSVLDFESRHDAAIVNAANRPCLGGGGIDGAISHAGGESLFRARLALPIVQGRSIRCKTGDAKLTGPGTFGDIKTNHVIHAVAPDYNDFREDEYDEADELLKSAYESSLEVARAANLEEIAFCLLAAGIFRGEKSLREVLSLACESISSWAKEIPEENSLRIIILCAYRKEEADALLDIAERLGWKKL